MTAVLLILLKVAVAGIILAIGMDSTLKDATYLWYRPGLLVRSVLAMYVLVPLAALALVKVLTLSPGVEIGLLVLAISAGAPLLPRKLMKIGDGAYIFSLVLTSSLLAIILVPAWLAVLAPHLRIPGRTSWARGAPGFSLKLIAGAQSRGRRSDYADCESPMGPLVAEAQEEGYRRSVAPQTCGRSRRLRRRVHSDFDRGALGHNQNRSRDRCRRWNGIVRREVPDRVWLVRIPEFAGPAAANRCA